MTTDDDEARDTVPEQRDGSSQVADPWAEELIRLRAERERLRALLARRESLLLVAARRLRRYSVSDPIATTIEEELGRGRDE